MNSRSYKIRITYEWHWVEIGSKNSETDLTNPTELVVVLEVWHLRGEKSVGLATDIGSVWCLKFHKVAYPLLEPHGTY